MSISSSAMSTPRLHIKVLADSPVIPSLPLHPEDSDPAMPPGLTYSTREWKQRITQLSSPTTTSRKRSRSFSPDTAGARRPPPGAASSFTNGGTNYKVEELKRELCDARRQIEAGVVREATIILEIVALGSSVPTRETAEESMLRERLQAVEAELRAETKLRIEAEAALTDFQRECREPFLVPAMIDVFETISRLTTQVMDVIHAEAGTV
ncbi:hypothetical protein DXG01_015487 [Tephrocybe rancida]|nr:hypothetical protein DXG01_015487 [Tephrocybe rancida]